MNIIAKFVSKKAKEYQVLRNRVVYAEKTEQTLYQDWITYRYKRDVSFFCTWKQSNLNVLIKFLITIIKYHWPITGQHIINEIFLKYCSIESKT